MFAGNVQILIEPKRDFLKQENLLTRNLQAALNQWNILEMFKNTKYQESHVEFWYFTWKHKSKYIIAFDENFNIIHVRTSIKGDAGIWQYPHKTWNRRRYIFWVKQTIQKLYYRTENKRLEKMLLNARKMFVKEQG